MVSETKNYFEEGKWEELGTLSSREILVTRGQRLLGRIMLILLLIFLLGLFLPWRQTIPGRGVVTALRPEDRPQTVQNQIGGRIEHWAVREGQKVNIGDTILIISETSQSYFDPSCLSGYRNNWLLRKVARMRRHKECKRPQPRSAPCQELCSSSSLRPGTK